jgi:serine/threonine protein kinase
MRAEQGLEGRVLVGRYHLDERIGRGGMGEVRAAVDDTLGRRVAVKLLRADLAQEPIARARFEAEARAAARLSHPNIVTVYDSGEDDGQPFLVMELLPGKTFGDEIASGRVAVERAVSVTSAVLSALSAAHHEGILHRDVKPGNVLLTTEDVPKVADFGIAKTADASATTATLTGELLATPAYLAPERLTGEAASPASDIYAAGVLLYEALAGETPYPARTPAELLRAISEGNAAPLHARRDDVPPAVVAVVERAMARDPSQRFASADAMSAALEAASQTREEPADPSIVARATEPVTVDASPAAVGANDGNTRALAPPPAPPPRRERERRVERAPREPRRARGRDRPRVRGARRVGWWAVAALVVVVAALGVVVALVAGGDDGPVVPPSASQPAPSGGATNLPTSVDHALDGLEQVTR